MFCSILCYVKMLLLKSLVSIVVGCSVRLWFSCGCLLRLLCCNSFGVFVVLVVMMIVLVSMLSVVLLGWWVCML